MSFSLYCKHRKSSSSPTGRCVLFLIHPLLLILLLKLSGDIETNPGPQSVEFPCGVCHRACRERQQAVQCDSCETWSHRRCLAMHPKIYNALANTSISWQCCNCGIPNFSSSLFNSTPSLDNSNRFQPLFDPRSHSHIQPKSPISTKQHCHTRRKKPPLTHNRPLRQSTPTKLSRCQKDCCRPKKAQRLDGTPLPQTRPGRSCPRSRTLSFLIVNFQSLRNKIPLFSNHMATHDPDIVFGSETWLHPGLKNAELEIPSHNIYRNDRSDGWGGAMVCIRSSIESSLVLTSNKTESVYCKIPQPGQPPIIVGCSYRPPNASSDYAQQVCQELFELKSQFKKSIFLIGGDFNLPDINWPHQTIDGCQYAKAINTAYMDTFLDLGLHQVITTPTRGDSILDLFLTPDPDLIESIDVVAGIGDHDIVKVTTRIEARRKKPTR